MKHYLIALLFTSIFFSSCEKEIIVIIEEEEVLIDSIDMEQFGHKHLDEFSLKTTREWLRKGTMEYRYFQEADSANLYIRVSLFATYKEAMDFLIKYINSISAGMSLGTEDMEPLGNEYWWYPSRYEVTNLVFRRYNAVIEMYAHDFNDITRFAHSLDEAIMNKEEYIYFLEEQE